MRASRIPPSWCSLPAGASASLPRAAAAPSCRRCSGQAVLAHTLAAVRASGLPWHMEDAGHPGMGDSIAAGGAGDAGCRRLAGAAGRPAADAAQYAAAVAAGAGRRSRRVADASRVARAPGRFRARCRRGVAGAHGGGRRRTDRAERASAEAGPRDPGVDDPGSSRIARCSDLWTLIGADGECLRPLPERRLITSGSAATSAPASGPGSRAAATPPRSDAHSLRRAVDAGGLREDRAVLLLAQLARMAGALARQREGQRPYRALLAWQASQRGSYTAVAISRPQRRVSASAPCSRGMRKTMPRQHPPESSPNTRPGRSGVPRLIRLHIFSARCQPCTRAGLRSANAKSGRQMSEP